MYQIDWSSKNRKWKLKISKHRSQLVDAVYCTVVCSNIMNWYPKPDIWIQNQNILFDDSYLTMVSED